jgi:hypothetical protein
MKRYGLFNAMNGELLETYEGDDLALDQLSSIISVITEDKEAIAAIRLARGQFVKDISREPPARTDPGAL